MMMRVLVVFTVLLTAISVIYRWRYKILNTILAITLLRKLTIAITMNMPVIKNKVLPKLFRRPINT